MIAPIDPNSSGRFDPLQEKPLEMNKPSKIEETEKRKDPLGIPAQQDVAHVAQSLASIHIGVDSESTLKKNIGQVTLENSLRKYEAFELNEKDSQLHKNVGAVDGKSALGAKADENVPKAEIESKPKID